MQITKPGKQRKKLYQAPLHARRKHFSACLSPKLKASRRVNALPVRSGDKVRVMRGDHRGFEGKVTRVDTKKYRVFIEGLTREKVDGTTVFVSIHPSKVMITGLNLEDKWRKEILERKKETGKELEKVKAGKVKAEKPPTEPVTEKSIVPVEKPSAKKKKQKTKPKTKKKSKTNRKNAQKKPVEKKGKREVKVEENKETNAGKLLTKKKRSKPKSSRKTATSGRTEKSRTAGRGK